MRAKIYPAPPPNVVWWLLLLVALGAGITGLVLGAVSVNRQDTGFSTPSLYVSRIQTNELVIINTTARTEQIPIVDVFEVTNFVAEMYHIVTDTWGYSVTKCAYIQNVTIPPGQCEMTGFGVNVMRHMTQHQEESGFRGNLTVTNAGETNTAAGTVEICNQSFAFPALTGGASTVVHFVLSSCQGLPLIENITNTSAVVSNAPTEFIEIHGNPTISDVVQCPLGLTCVSRPAGSVPMEANATTGTFSFYREVCNTFIECGMYLSMMDYARLMAAQGLVVESQATNVYIYTGECEPVPAPGEGAVSHSISYWKSHNGCNSIAPDYITPLLPITLGCPQGHPNYLHGINVTNALLASSILEFYGSENGLDNLAAHLLLLKLNGGSSTEGDEALCQYGFNPGSNQTFVFENTGFGLKSPSALSLRR